MRSCRERCVLDGEIVIATERGLDFDVLQLRIHPAASRVKLLSQQTPASIVFFDLLCEGDRDLCGEPFQERRKQLEALLAAAPPPIHITPATHEASVASDWFRRFEGAGLDGVMAKPMDGTYEPDKRVMLKIKHERDCDCVVAGFRWHKTGEGNVGSLLLGLFDDSGSLQHVGVCASFTQEKRRELAEFLLPYRRDALANHPWGGWAEPGRRWAAHAGRSEPLEPGQGPVVGAAATGAGGGSGVRAHAGQPLPPHGPISQMAHRQAAERLHLRATGSGSTAGADGNFRQRTLMTTWRTDGSPLAPATWAATRCFGCVPGCSHRLSRCGIPRKLSGLRPSSSQDAEANVGHPASREKQRDLVRSILLLALAFFEARFDAPPGRHSRVGSSSGSGVSCGGRSSSGTWRRLTRMRVHVEDVPRMESTSTSSTARRAATSGCLLFHLSRPASAASLLGEFATTINGIFVRGGLLRG